MSLENKLRADPVSKAQGGVAELNYWARRGRGGQASVLGAYLAKNEKGASLRYAFKPAGSLSFT
jgi:hypothetical protein